MKSTAIYQLTVTAKAGGSRTFHFLQMPTPCELAEVFNNEIKQTEIEAEEADNQDDPDYADRFPDWIDELIRLRDVVKHASEFVAPLPDNTTQLKVKIAGVQIGTISVNALPAFARDADRELQALCA